MYNIKIFILSVKLQIFPQQLELHNWRLQVITRDYTYTCYKPICLYIPKIRHTHTAFQKYVSTLKYLYFIHYCLGKVRCERISKV